MPIRFYHIAGEIDTVRGVKMQYDLYRVINDYYPAGERRRTQSTIPK
jgi:hypothetical protein